MNFILTLCGVVSERLRIISAALFDGGINLERLNTAAYYDVSDDSSLSLPCPVQAGRLEAYIGEIPSQINTT